MVAKKADKPEEAEVVEEKPARDPSECVVENDGPHVGKAGGVNGAVCSRHAMHYDRNGRRRA